MVTTITTADSYSFTALSAHKPSAKTTLAFKCTLIFVFLRFSYLHELVTYITGVNTYMLYVFGPVAILAAIFAGGFRRTFQEGGPARFWLGFAVWMILAIPFSSWVGGSFTHVITYIRTDFIMLPVIAGLATTWSDCKKLICTVAWAGVCDVAAGQFLSTNKWGGDRLSVRWAGSIGNSNDFAAHLLLILPFVLFIVLAPRTRLLVRATLAGTIILGIFEILRTGSRGAVVALIIAIIFLLIGGTVRQRIAVGATAIIAVLVLITFLSADTWKRLTSFSEGSQSSDEAMLSSQERQDLLKLSIAYTFDNPLFGIGPGQFQNYQGTSARHGTLTAWRQAHNSYTQISSECGIPALGFYLAAIVSTFGLLAKIRKRAKGDKEIGTAAYCIATGSVAYCAAALFVNFGYAFEFVAVSGLVIAIWWVVGETARALPSYGVLSCQSAPYGSGTLQVNNSRQTFVR